MTSHGYPDWQRYAVWLASPIVQETALAIGAGSVTRGPFQVSNYASVILAIKPTGGTITATIKQTVPTGPASLVLTETVVVANGATLFEAFVLFGGAVELDLQGSAGGETVDYALYPSNTTTNAQVITQATINVQHNDALIAAEPTVDLGDSDVTFVVADDAPNTRVKISGIISLISRAVKIAAGGNNQLTIEAPAGAASVLELTTTEVAAGNRNWAIRNRYTALGQLELVVGTAQGTDPNLGANVAEFDSAGITTLRNRLIISGSTASGRLPIQQWNSTVSGKQPYWYSRDDAVFEHGFNGILGSIITTRETGLVQINGQTAQRTTDGLGAHMERGSAVTDGSGNVSVSFTLAFTSSVSVVTDVLNADARSNAHLTGVGISNFQAHAEVIGAGSIAGVNLWWIASGI